MQMGKYIYRLEIYFNFGTGGAAICSNQLISIYKSHGLYIIHRGVDDSHISSLYQYIKREIWHTHKMAWEMHTIDNSSSRIGISVVAQRRTGPQHLYNRRRLYPLIYFHFAAAAAFY